MPNITPDLETGIGSWSEGDIVQVLKTGLKPDYDAVGASMGEAVRDGLQDLTDADLQAIAAYLKSVPAVKNTASRKKKGRRSAAVSLLRLPATPLKTNMVAKVGQLV